MSGFLLDAVTMLLRWLHVVAAIAWIGESFYFVMLDRALKPPRDGTPGVAGELWSVHGGGFYLKRKFATAPAEMPADLHWSMWKSYTTWLSGFALFTVMYLASPAIWLVDPAVAAWTPTEAVGLALAFPVVAWLAYDALCRVIGFRDAWLGVAVGALAIVLAYAATHLFAGRAAFLIVGAALGTIMSANVFFVIIPGQRRMVAALARGEPVDPLPGQRGKQRSVHNTYLTLPVVFAMLSTHYATAYAHEHAWLVLVLFMAAGALIRQFFVLWHAGRRAWGFAAAGAILIVFALTFLAPRAAPVGPVVPPAPVATGDAVPAGTTSGAPAIDAAAIAAAVPADATIFAIATKHCAACHSSRPTLMPTAPLGAMFDTPAQVDAYASRIHQQTVVLRVMPPGNITGLTEDERAAIDRWFKARGSR